MSRLNELVSLASPPLGPALTAQDKASLPAGAADVIRLLEAKNGFFAFEMALHVFPLGDAVVGHDIRHWNKPEVWRAEYGTDAEGLFFFAEDIFGMQFALDTSRVVVRFDPETGRIERFAGSLEQWAALVLDELEVETGYPLAHEWQVSHRPLKPRERLLPKTPFVMGGEFNVDNLYASDAIEGMKFRAHIARQIKDVPDGAQVELVVVDTEKDKP